MSFNVLHKLSCDEAIPLHVIFSRDGTMLACGDSVGIIRIWNVISGELQQTINCGGGGAVENLRSIDFSPDGATIISVGNENNNIKFWNIATGDVVRTLDLHGQGSLLAIFTPTGENIISTSVRGGINIWDAETGELIKTLGSEHPLSFTLSSDGNTIIQVGAKNFPYSPFGEEVIKLWDIETGDVIRELRGDNYVRTAAVSLDTKTIISATERDHKINIWGVETSARILTLDSDTNLLKFIPGSGFISCGIGRITFWDNNYTRVSSLKIPERENHQVGYIKSIDVNKTGTNFALGSMDKFVYIFKSGVDALHKADILVGAPLEGTPQKAFLPRETRELIAEYSVKGAKLDDGLIEKHYKGEAPFRNTLGGKRKSRRGRKNKSKIKRKQSKKNKK